LGEEAMKQALPKLRSLLNHWESNVGEH